MRLEKFSTVGQIQDEDVTLIFRENCSAFQRGSNWNNTSDAGVFALNLNNAPTNTNNNIGFRCASDQKYARMEWHVFKDICPVSKDHQVFSGPPM